MKATVGNLLVLYLAQTRITEFVDLVLVSGNTRNNRPLALATLFMLLVFIVTLMYW